MRAARSPQWLVDPKKPVDLQDEDPEIFSAYLNMVYFGAGTIDGDHLDLMPGDPQALSLTEVEELHAPKDQAPTDDAIENKASSLQDAFDMSLKECDERATGRDNNHKTPYSTACDAHFTTLARIHILADKLGDPTTANLVIDEFVNCASYETTYNPSDKVVNLIYRSTVHGSPLRRLMRDIWVYQTGDYSYLDYHAVHLHEDFIRDIMVESLRTRLVCQLREGCEHKRFLSAKTCADPCHYHLHQVDRCVSKAIASATPCALAKQS